MRTLESINTLYDVEIFYFDLSTMSVIVLPMIKASLTMPTVGFITNTLVIIRSRITSLVNRYSLTEHIDQFMFQNLGVKDCF